jgi:predicted acetyltransferase
VIGVDYDFATLDLDDPSEEATQRRRAWLGAVLRGFHEGRPSDEALQVWLRTCAADRATIRGAWVPQDAFGAGAAPVATYASFDKTLSTGSQLLPLRMITDVTTSPAHRRRGLLRRLITDDLADAVAAGVPMAALTASEGTIYGRWGFGVATFNETVEVDTGPRFGLRDFTDPGRVEILEPTVAWPHVKAVADRFHATRRGSVEWPAQYEDIHTGTFDFSEGGPDKKLWTALHLDASGEVDGFVVYKHDGRDGDKRKIKVTEMLGLTAPAQLALWEFLAGIDLTNHVTHGVADPEDPLPWALSDVNAVRVTGRTEFLWLRVLDVERSLAARPWGADGEIVLAVTDDLGHAAGTYAVRTAGGRAEVTRTSTDPGPDADLTVDAETLATLYLSTAPVAQLHAAGRIAGDAEAVARFGSMADLAGAPYSITGF